MIGTCLHYVRLTGKYHHRQVRWPALKKVLKSNNRVPFSYEWRVKFFVDLKVVKKIIDSTLVRCYYMFCVTVVLANSHFDALVNIVWIRMTISFVYLRGFFAQPLWYILYEYWKRLLHKGTTEKTQIFTEKNGYYNRKWNFKKDYRLCYWSSQTI